MNAQINIEWCMLMLCQAVIELRSQNINVFDRVCLLDQLFAWAMGIKCWSLSGYSQQSRNRPRERCYPCTLRGKWLLWPWNLPEPLTRPWIVFALAVAVVGSQAAPQKPRRRSIRHKANSRGVERKSAPLRTQQWTLCRRFKTEYFSGWLWKSFTSARQTNSEHPWINGEVFVCYER